MDVLAIGLWGVTGAALVLSLLKDKKRTFQSFKMAKGMMKGLIGQVTAILFLIGLLLTFIPPELIKQYLSSSNAFIATVISAVVGAITLIPAFVAFPLAGSLADAGVGVVPLVAFITTLTMVGFVTFPLERREFGTKFALTRNAISFIFAIIIALLMGVIL